MNENIGDEEGLLGQDMEPRDRLQTLLQSKQDSTYSLSQYLLLSIFPLAVFLFIGFEESYVFIGQILARIVLILIIIVLLITYLLTKKKDVLYMIISYIIVFPILVFLAYFDQMVALLTLSVLGFLPWIQIQRRKYPFSSRKESKKNIQTNKSQDKSFLEK